MNYAIAMRFSMYPAQQQAGQRIVVERDLLVSRITMEEDIDYLTISSLDGNNYDQESYKFRWLGMSPQTGEELFSKIHKYENPVIINEEKPPNSDEILTQTTMNTVLARGKIHLPKQRKSCIFGFERDKSIHITFHAEKIKWKFEVFEVQRDH